MNPTTQQSMQPANGQSEGRLAEVLTEEVTVGYKPTMPLESLWVGGSELPMTTLRRDIEIMQWHPIVITALEYYRAGLSGAEFWGGPDQADPKNDQGKPISLDTRVAQFCLAHVERFWQRGVPLLQEGGYPYGWAPGEHLYREKNGMLTWSHLKHFHPNDGHILSLDYEPIGVRVKGIRSKTPVEMWTASDRVPAKGCWYAHRPKFQQFYGRSQLTGGWRPWRRLAWRDSTEQVVDAAIYRAGYKGPVCYYPPGNSAPTARQGIPGTAADGGGLFRRENRDIARQVIEWAKAGAGFALSSEQWPQAQGGGPRWKIEWPDHVMDVRPLIEAARYLEDQIFLGIGVPPELVKAGGTGSGYSGRSIPREAFLNQQQAVANAILQMFVEQVLRPLVLWNFGDIPFDIQVKSLLKTQADDKMGEEGGQKPGEQQGEGGKGKPPGGPEDSNKAREGKNIGQPPSPEPALSLNHRSKVLSIVQRVMARRAA